MRTFLFIVMMANLVMAALCVWHDKSGDAIHFALMAVFMENLFLHFDKE